MGHSTSISMEQDFWDALDSIAQEKGTSLRQLVTQIDLERTAPLSSAVRIFILNEFIKKSKLQKND